MKGAVCYVVGNWWPEIMCKDCLNGRSVLENPVSVVRNGTLIDQVRFEWVPFIERLWVWSSLIEVRIA